MSFTFNNKNLGIDNRARFANSVCQLLVNSKNGDLNESLQDVGSLYKEFECNVRNIYELIDSQIPLFALYELTTNGADNWDFNDEEYSTALLNCRIACIEYYGTTN
jgi:hypothetical protein